MYSYFILFLFPVVVVAVVVVPIVVTTVVATVVVVVVKDLSQHYKNRRKALCS